MNTYAPSSTNSLADASAIPEVAPVITATFPSNLPISTLLHVRFGSSEISKAGSLIERTTDANDRRLRDEAQSSDARSRERLQNTAQEHSLFIGPRRWTVRAICAVAQRGTSPDSFAVLRRPAR